jgi:hypothetical protein
LQLAAALEEVKQAVMEEMAVLAVAQVTVQLVRMQEQEQQDKEIQVD